MFLDASFYTTKREKNKAHGFGWVGSGKNLEGVGGGRIMVRTHCIKNLFSKKNKRKISV